MSTVAVLTCAPGVAAPRRSVGSRTPLAPSAIGHGSAVPGSNGRPSSHRAIGAHRLNGVMRSARGPAVIGGSPSATRPSQEADAMTVGPIQAFVIGFPDNDLFEGRIAEELARLSDVGAIRIIDAVFVMREGDDVAVVGVSDLDDEQRAELRAAVGALVGLGVAGVEGAEVGAAVGLSADSDSSLSEALAESLVDDLPDGSSALVLAIEHLWAVPLRDAVRDAGGVVIAHRSLTAEDLVAFGMDLADED